MATIPQGCSYILISSNDWSGDYTCLNPYIDELYYQELFNHYDSFGALTRFEAQEVIWNFVISKECQSTNDEPPSNGELPLEPALDMRIIILIFFIIAFVILLKEFKTND